MKKLKDLDNETLLKRQIGLVDLADTLDQLEIPFMLSDGVLLGAVRDGGFIPWDWDVEISIKVEDIFNKSDSLLEQLKKNDFDLDKINLVWDNYKVNAYKHGTKFSLIGFYEEGEYRMRSAWKYPKIFFDRLEKFVFLNRTYHVPSPPESYLEFQYGDWRTPLRDNVKRNYLTSDVYRDNNYAKRAFLYFKSKTESLKTKLKKYLKFLIANKNNREPIFQLMYESSIIDNCNIIEIGSSDGREASLAIKNFKNKIKNIFIIEPDPENLKNAKWNILKNDKSNITKFFNAGIGVKTQSNPFYLSSKASNLNSSISTFHLSEKINTQYYKLDEFIKENLITTPLLIKMDIEGFEVEILNSIIDYLISNKDIYILMELHPSRYSKNRSMLNLLDKLFSNNYYPLLIESAGRPIPSMFAKKDMNPIFSTTNRGLYYYPEKEFVKTIASKNIHDKISESYLTPKIARSLLISNSLKEFKKPKIK
tara:strand:+ start:25542 stop:26978 length:1437 start_codon:yes stop_codon:yes gene_type:complete